MPESLSASPPIQEQDTKKQTFRQWVGATLLGITAATFGYVSSPSQEFEAATVSGKLEIQDTHPFAGGTKIDFSAGGNIKLNTHHLGPGVEVSFTDIEDSDNPEQIPSNITKIHEPEKNLEDSIDDAKNRLILGALAGSAACISAIAGGVYLSSRERQGRYKQPLRVALTGGLTSLSLLAAPLMTHNSDSLENPEYDGLTKHIEQVLGSVKELSETYPEYIATVGGNLSYLQSLYQATITSPGLEEDNFGILVTSDIHCMPGAYDLIGTVTEANPNIKAVLDGGDLTDFGSPLENTLCFDGVDDLGAPFYTVKGNHDSAETMQYLESLPNVGVLDESRVVIEGLNVWGFGDGRNPSIPDGQEFAAPATKPVLPAGTDIVVAHSPKNIEQFIGKVPIAISGDTHQQLQEVKQDTLLVNPGTTGASFLRAFSGTKPEERTASIIHFSRETLEPIAITLLNLGKIGSHHIQLQTCFIEGVDERNVACG